MTLAPVNSGVDSTLKSQPSDPYAYAVTLYRDGQGKLFDFCVEAAGVVGNYEEGRTAGLAQRIMASITTVQNHAKVGKLWLAMIETYPSDAEILRDELYVGHWLPVARLWAGEIITLAGAFQWLKLARGKTVEAFKNSLPNEGGSEYGITLKQLEFKIDSIMATVDEAITAPSFGVDPVKYKEFIQALKVVRELAPQVMRKDL